MSSLKYNIAANYAGHIWTSIMGFVFAPLYIKFMGVESYGLVGLSAALSALFMILDLGLGATIVRESARLATGDDAGKRLADLVRTLELVYGLAAVAIGVSVVSASGWIARHWVNPGQLSEEVVTNALVIIGLSLAARWPSTLYSGGLIGLQKQLLFNGITMVAATMRGAGSVVILWLVSPTIGSFLVWRLITDVSQTLCTGWCLWKALPGPHGRPRFRKEVLAACWKFSAGMSATGIFFVILSEMDKIVLSAMLPLATFGYYAFASVAASTLLGLAYPITTAVFPRLSQIEASGDIERLRETYHWSAQVLTVAIAPAAAVLVFFSREALLAWTGQPAAVENAALLVSILAAGTGICGILRLPHALQMAHGWTWLGAATNGISILIGLPLLVWLAGWYGAVGGALVWPIVNVAQMVVSVKVMHRRILTAELGHWCVRDVGIPLMSAVCVVGVTRLWLWEQPSRMGSLIEVTAVLGFALAAAACAAPDVRTSVKEGIKALLRRR
ncbi:MAG: oligosaccharide flippase family protein [Desulfomonile sp.]|nr:oligosaccharide flippase family protein [Desulfomonile sp.]